MAEESTTPDLVELTRQSVDAWNGRDFDAVTSLFAPDSVWETPPMGISFEGIAIIRSFIEDWTGGYEEYRVEAQELLDLGNGVVLVVARVDARPGDSTGSMGLRYHMGGGLGRAGDRVQRHRSGPGRRRRARSGEGAT